MELSVVCRVVGYSNPGYRSNFLLSYLCVTLTRCKCVTTPPASMSLPSVVFFYVYAPLLNPGVLQFVFVFHGDEYGF